MSDFNPYEPPLADVNQALALPTVSGTFLPEGRAVDAGNGFTWISRGYDLFRRSPGIWIAIIVVYVVVLFAVELVPIFGGIAGMLAGPLFSAGFILGCAAQDRGEELTVGHLFAGFGRSLGSLVAVAGINVGCIVVIVLVALLIGGGMSLLSSLSPGHVPDLSDVGLPMILGVLLGLALIIPLGMATYYAPALIVLQDLGPVAALRASFFGCLKNILPFLVFCIGAFAVSLAGTLALCVGLLVAIPVLIAAVYASYRDIFYAPAA